MAGSIEMKPIKEVEQPEKEDNRKSCSHEHVEIYVTAGRYAPPKAYWSCENCGESFAPTADSDTEELLALREAADVAHKFLLDIGYDKEMAVCAKLRKALGK